MSGKLDLAANVGYTGSMAPLKAWLLSPSYRVVVLHRISAKFSRGGPIGKIVSRFAWMRIVKGYGSYISPKSTIGAGLALPHPTAIVIGDGAIIGQNVTIYQSVTLGRRNNKRAEYPRLGDNVTVYAGAVIVGAVTIGDGAVIGANALVTTDVPTGGIVTQKASEMIVRRT